MSRCLASIPLYLLLAGLVVADAPRQNPGKGGPAATVNLSDLSLEINALQTIYDLELSTLQLKSLAELANGAAKARPRKNAKASAKLVTLMTGLRETLAKGDERQIDDLNDKVDAQREKESLTLDDDVDITDTARKRAPDAVRLLSARQVADHLATYEELPEPLASVQDSLQRGLKADAKKWTALRDEAAQEASWLIAGFDADRAKKVRAQVAALLDKAHTAKGDELKKQQDEIEKAMQEIMGDVGPTDVLAHIMERDLAELLSNPLASKALESRLKQ